MPNKTQTGLNVGLTKNPSADDFDKIRAFLGSDFTSSETQAFSSGVYVEDFSTNRLSSVVDTAPNSLANRYALFTYMGLHGERTDKLKKFYRDQVENYIVSSDVSRKPTVRTIIEYFNNYKGGIEYSYADFLYCKYFKQIPNNYLITLRRFAQPTDDNIFKNVKNYIKDVKNKQGSDIEAVDITLPDLARAVTWMSEATGNRMEDVLSFAYGYNWKEQVAETNTQQSTDGGYTSQPFYAKTGIAGQAFFDTLKGVSVAEKERRERYSGHDPLKETYENFVLGPINVINKMHTKDVGLNFDQEIKLTFNYELKSYDGINPRIALLDIFANLMVLTYSNANFWGGANRFLAGGGFVASRFGDWRKLAAGDLSGYFKSVVTEVSTGFGNVFGTSDGGFSKDSLLSGLKKVGGSLLQNMLGGMLNKIFGSAPAYMAVKGFITGESTGNWHVTIGNPMNPIAMIGNLILVDSNLTFHGGMGRDDFPNEMRLEVTLKHARPRDKTDFESMFNAGKGRLYAAAAKFEDILNLEGKDQEVYGAFQFDEKGRAKRGTALHKDDIEASDNLNLGSAVATGKRRAKQFGKWTGNKGDVVLNHFDRWIHQ